MIHETPEVDEQERGVIERTDEIRRTLSYAVQSRRWTGMLRRVTFARAIQGSNTIEGYNVTVDDAIAAAANEEPLDAQSETWAAIMGYRDAMTYVLQLSDDPHFAFSRGLIRGLHYMMLKYDLAKHPGRWRPGPIFVRNDQTGKRVYEGPPAETVNELMRKLVSDLAVNDAPVLVKAAMAHLNLVMIHPFADGNGRMGRCIQTLVLARERILDPTFCSIEEYLGRNQQPYYDVLTEVGAGAWHPERSARPWIRFCLTAHYRQASTLLRRSRIMQRVWDSLEEEIRHRGLPERAIFALADGAMGYRVRNATYRPIADISIELASRDLKLMADQGLLESHGERRGRYYLGSEVLRRIRVSADEPNIVVDPFLNQSGFLPGLGPPLP